MFMMMCDCSVMPLWRRMRYDSAMALGRQRYPEPVREVNLGEKSQEGKVR